MLNRYQFFIILVLFFLLSSCGFHLQNAMPLAPPLHKMYLQSIDPYGQLTRSLRQLLKLSHVQLVSSPTEASTVLAILKDSTSQNLLSVSGTNQTRQYNLVVTVIFEINNNKGQTMVNQQTLSETRTITVQSNQILGSRNEANIFYQQMRRILAAKIMDRIASKEISVLVNTFPTVSHNAKM